MAEMFIFTQGEGILHLGGVNYTVSKGTVSLIFPPTKHTIFNTGIHDPLELFTIASVP